jgi:hypothetical protein
LKFERRFDYDEIESLARSGLPRAEIARKVGSSKATITLVLQQRDVRNYCDNCGKVTRRDAYAICNSEGECRKLAMKAAWKRRNKIHPLYSRWVSAKQRCTNPNAKCYGNYGGRGIAMSALWLNDFGSFERWINENLGPCPEGYSLDRIDNDGNYEPGNLRWASRIEQRNNARDPIVLSNARYAELLSLAGLAALWRHVTALRATGGNVH